MPTLTSFEVSAALYQLTYLPELKCSRILIQYTIDNELVLPDVIAFRTIFFQFGKLKNSAPIFDIFGNVFSILQQCEHYIMSNYVQMMSYLTIYIYVCTYVGTYLLGALLEYRTFFIGLFRGIFDVNPMLTINC